MAVVLPLVTTAIRTAGAGSSLLTRTSRCWPTGKNLAGLH